MMERERPAVGELMTLQEVGRRARYGHRAWVAWEGREGSLLAARASRAAIKAALLATGTRGRFFIVGASTGVTYRHGWRAGCLMMRNADFLWGRGASE